MEWIKGVAIMEYASCKRIQIHKRAIIFMLTTSSASKCSSTVLPLLLLLCHNGAAGEGSIVNIEPQGHLAT